MNLRSFYSSILILLVTACTANDATLIPTPEETQTMEATAVPLATDSPVPSPTAEPRATPQPTLKAIDTPTAEQEQSTATPVSEERELPKGFASYDSPAISLAYPEEWEVYRGPFPGSMGIGTFSPFYGGVSQGEDSAVVIIMEEISGLEGPLTALEDFYLPAFAAGEVLEPAQTTTINNQNAATATVVCEDEILACHISVIAGSERGLVLIAIAHKTRQETFGPLFDQVLNSTIIHSMPPLADLATLRKATADYESYSDAELGVSLRHPVGWTVMTNEMQMLVSPSPAQEANSLLTVVPVEMLESMLDAEASLEEIVSQYRYGNLHISFGDVLPISDMLLESVEGQDIAWQLFGSTGATALVAQHEPLTIIVAAFDNGGHRVVATAYIDDEVHRESMERVISSIIVSGRSYELPSDAALLEHGGVYEGMWSAGEEIYLAFDATEEESLLMVLDTLEGVAKIEILNPEGYPVPGAREEYVRHDLSASVLLVEPGQSGRYHTRISDALSGGGRFKLYLFDLGPETPLAVERVENSLPSGSADEYVIDALAGQAVIVQGKSAGALRLVLQDSSGNYVREHRSSGNDPASLFLIPEADADYIVEVTELNGQAMDYELLIVREVR